MYVCIPPLPSRPIRFGFRMDAMTRRDLSTVASSSCLYVCMYVCMYVQGYQYVYMYE